MKKVYFVRHGESEANALGICAGHTDVALTREGLEQARQAGHNLLESGQTIDLIVSSPLKRALTTAQEIARYIGYPEENIVLQRDAMERFRGDLEGRPSREQDGMTDEEFAAHGAESEAELLVRAERLRDFVTNRPEQSILIVSHNQFGRSFIAHAKGVTWQQIDKLPNAHVFPIEFSDL